MSYIEREPLLEILNGLYDHHLTMLNYAADGATQDCINAVIEAPTVNIKAEVAREIFEEIEEILSNVNDFAADSLELEPEERYGAEVACVDLGMKFAELKKKYESEKDNG